MSGSVPVSTPSGTNEVLTAALDAACRTRGLELAVQLHSARARAGDVSAIADYRDGEVLATANRFADYLRGGGDG
jgi:hypothetical protein